MNPILSGSQSLHETQGDSPDRLAEDLGASQRVQLTGEGGPLTALTQRALQAAPEAGWRFTWVRPVRPDGTQRRPLAQRLQLKTVRTEIGDVWIEVPRDREGSFEPVIVTQHQRGLAGFDQAVISLYAKA